MEFKTAEYAREQIRTVAARWDAVYGPRFDFQIVGPGDSRSISEALHSFDPETASADDVAVVIGNGSWVEMPMCLECKTATTDAAGFGDEDIGVAWCCAQCMRRALRKLAGDRRRKTPNV